MTEHLEVGRKGETLAEAWLKQKGFRIIDHNWRYGKCEIDLIAEKYGIPHFVEVKTRSGSTPVLPEYNVTRTKIRTLLRGISAYIDRHPCYNDFRLDILSICLNNGKEVEYFFIEDVYL